MLTTKNLRGYVLKLLKSLRSMTNNCDCNLDAVEYSPALCNHLLHQKREIYIFLNGFFEGLDLVISQSKEDQGVARAANWVPVKTSGQDCWDDCCAA